MTAHLRKVGDVMPKRRLSNEMQRKLSRIGGPQVIEIGQDPPWLLAHCASCRMMVEGYTKHAPREDGKFEFEARCHGQTQSVMVTNEYLRERWATGLPLVMFKGPLRSQVGTVVAKHAR